MEQDIHAFFATIPGSLPLFETIRGAILAIDGGIKIKVQKTQITFFKKYGFAFVSHPSRKVKNRPKPYVIFTLGLGRQLDSPRVNQAVEPYPGRWTHHFVISEISQIDDELINWIKEAFVFSMHK
jgi:hypothetical protein